MGACATTPPPPEVDTASYWTPQFVFGEKRFLEGEFSQAASHFEQFIQEHPTSPYASDAAHWAGRCYMKTGQYARAQTYFEQALVNPRTQVERVLAKMGLADSLFMQKQYDKAKPIYEEVWNNRDIGNVPADLVLYRIGQCDQRRGRTALAKQSFKQLKLMYPNSKYASRATTAPTPTPAQVARHYVQLGLYSKKLTAEEVADNLRAKGITVRIAKQISRGKTLYAIRTGSFRTLAKAEAEERRLKKIGIDAVAK